MVIVDSVVVGLLGGLLTLDRTAVPQIMLSRPIVAATLTGCILGDPLHGLVAGFLLELLWLGELPVGAKMTTNDAALAVIVAGVAIIGGRYLGGTDMGMVVLSALLLLPAGWIFMKVDEAIRDFNSSLARRALSLCREDERVVARTMVRGIMAFFLPNTLLIWLFTAAGVVLIRYLYPFTVSAEPALVEGVSYVFPLVGAGAVVSTLRGRGQLLVLILGYTLFLYLLL